MLKIIISGCNGYMGRTVASIAESDPDVEVVAGFDFAASDTGPFPIYSEPMEFSGSADAVIDFSNPSALENLLLFCEVRKIPPILCTTGYTPEHLTEIERVSKIVPVFRSGNMSLGINLVADLIKRAASVLGTGYDVEIVERHHRRKLDAPSGTALLLADAVSSAMPDDTQYRCARHDRREARQNNEIGISAVRGGTIVGEHEVIFAGLDEVIEIKHTAYSREIFASGAIKAAKFFSSARSPGLYDMNSILRA